MLFDDLVPAKFKNVRLLVRKESLTYGLLKQENLSPTLSNIRSFTNLIKIPEKITLDIVFTGVTASFDAQRFLQLANEQNSGRLIIPTFGLFDSMQIVDPPVLNTDMTKVGVINTTVTFAKVVNENKTINLFAKLEAGLQILRKAVYAINDAFYIFTNVQGAIVSIQSGINNALNGVNAGSIAIKDLSNAFSLNSFLESVQLKLQSTEKALVKDIYLDIKAVPIKTNINQLINKQAQSLYISLITFQLIIGIAYMEQASNIDSYNSQEDIKKELTFLTFLSNDLITQNFLSNEVLNLIKQSLEFLTNLLNDTFDNLPEVYTIKVQNESSLLIAYRTTGDIDNVNLIERINPQINNIADITGLVTCLKFL